jgi:hypothetical protein
VANESKGLGPKKSIQNIVAATAVFNFWLEKFWNSLSEFRAPGTIQEGKWGEMSGMHLQGCILRELKVILFPNFPKEFI